MSLQTRIAALITAIKGDYNGLDTRLTTLENAGGGGGGQSLSIAQVRNASVSENINSSSTWTTRTVNDTVDFLDAGFTVNTSTNGISCSFTGRVRVTTHIGYTVSGARVNVAVRAAKNGNGLPIEGKSGYVRNATGHNEASCTAIQYVDVVPGNTISLQTKQEAASTATYLDLGGGMLLLERMS